MNLQNLGLKCCRNYKSLTCESELEEARRNNELHCGESKGFSNFGVRYKAFNRIQTFFGNSICLLKSQCPEGQTKHSSVTPEKRLNMLSNNSKHRVCWGNALRGQQAVESADLPGKERRIADKGVSGESTVILAISNSSFHRTLFSKSYLKTVRQNKTTAKYLNFPPQFRKIILGKSLGCRSSDFSRRQIT